MTNRGRAFGASGGAYVTGMDLAKGKDQTTTVMVERKDGKMQVVPTEEQKRAFFAMVYSALADLCGASTEPGGYADFIRAFTGMTLPLSWRFHSLRGFFATFTADQDGCRVILDPLHFSPENSIAVQETNDELSRLAAHCQKKGGLR